MKAIILAAGYGTRLKPLTDYLPKALVRIAGKPLLQIAIERLLCAGISDIGINVHHFSEQIIEFLHKHRFFGAEITLSPENKILGTGGGAKRLIRRMGEDEAFLIINVDVLTDLDFAQFSAAFVRENADALLAVKHRTTQRYLLTDSEATLCGRGKPDRTVDFLVRQPVGALDAVAFNGLQLVHPAVLSSYQETVFSTIDAYLEWARNGSTVKIFSMDHCYWLDVGRPETLFQAEQDIASGHLQI